MAVPLFAAIRHARAGLFKPLTRTAFARRKDALEDAQCDCKSPPSPASVRPQEDQRMTEPRLSFKEMCARFDVTPRTLRYYEYIELLAPEKEGRARFYGAREIARMTLILRGRRFGFSLEEIRQWLLIYQQKGTGPQMAAWIAMADRQLEALAAQKAELEMTIDDLRALRETAASALNG
jgi:DNA-binding transcriptional MerR regulator